MLLISSLHPPTCPRLPQPIRRSPHLSAPAGDHWPFPPASDRLRHGSVLFSLVTHRAPPTPLRSASAVSFCSVVARFILSNILNQQFEMKYLSWYLKISAVSALIGASMELFMIHTGFYDKVTVLESEKRAWESSPEALAIKEALNPWRKQDDEAKKQS